MILKKQYYILILGVILMFGLSGCGKTKYNLSFDGYGFKSDKTSYSEGETVTVYYDMIATDTDYNFYTDSDDVKLKQDYGSNGYVFTFNMPAHDVKISVKTKNSMTADPQSNKTDNLDPSSPEDYIINENMVFDYFDKTVATDGNDEYTEFVLYKYTDDKLILVQYNKKPDEDETMDYCFVSASVLEDCMGIVNNYNLDEWDGKTGIDGKLYVIKFLKNNELIRVSSEEMPDDGMTAIKLTSGILVSAWDNGKADLQTETWFCPECGTKNNTRYCSGCGLEKDK